MTPNWIKPAAVLLAALGFTTGVPGGAAAGYVTATLTASPSSLPEGGGTTLTLTLQNSPYYTPNWDYNYYYYSSYYTGYGYIADVSGTFSPGNPGGSSQSLSAYSGSNYFQAAKSFTYANAGTYTASVSGSVGTYDEYYYYYYGYNYSYTSSSFSASTTVNVSNLLPTITSIQWDAVVNTSVAGTFTVLATDPGLGAPGSPALTYAFDLNGDGSYETASSSASGGYLFTTAGIHHIGVRVADNEGGYTYGSFDVNVVNPPVANPAPPGLLLALTGVGCLGGFGWVRRRKPATTA